MSDRVVFFTTDSGYLVPTLVAARQVQEQACVKGLADVAIFLIDIDDSTVEKLQISFPGLSFHRLAAASFELPISARFNRTHVPRSALARLVVGEHVSTSYEHVVYLDGDIQVIGDVNDLLAFDVPYGNILAAPDVAEIVWPEFGEFASGFRRYAQGLGVDQPQDYFNSGVLAARRETWLELGREAFAFMTEHSELCRFHDQSALNRVARCRRMPLSPRFNMTSPYQALFPDAARASSILHFTGGEKPWADGNTNRSIDYSWHYTALVATHPYLEAFWSTTSGRKPGDPRSRKGPKWRSWLEDWRLGRRRQRINADRRNFYLS